MKSTKVKQDLISYKIKQVKPLLLAEVTEGTGTVAVHTELTQFLYKMLIDAPRWCMWLNALRSEIRRASL